MARDLCLSRSGLSCILVFGSRRCDRAGDMTNDALKFQNVAPYQIDIVSYVAINRQRAMKQPGEKHATPGTTLLLSLPHHEIGGIVVGDKRVMLLCGGRWLALGGCAEKFL